MNSDRIYYSNNAQMHALRARIRLTLLFLTIGLGIGGALALLFAPVAGKKTRSELKKNIEDGYQNGLDTVGSIVKKLEKDFGEVQSNVEKRIKDLT